VAMFSAGQAFADPGPSAGKYFTQESLRAEGRFNAAARLDPPPGDQDEFYAYQPMSAERHTGVNIDR
ncbi:MAG: hypothetical protein JWL62_1463, partial [Hyphomicrobiales bacterium]|nr:hypothetical protein [Hyphomicrobiales bacterium]